MAITVDCDVKRIGKRHFHEIDYLVTGLAYSMHNEFGRLWNESIYKKELANRCREAGFKNVLTELEVCVSHKHFSKKYCIDLMIENSVLYELKTVQTLMPEHERQTLNYLFLCGLQHAKLFNFRAALVKSRFVSTTIKHEDRYALEIFDQNWIDFDEDSIWFKNFMLALLKDWGAYLEISLFYEAIYYFRGGENQVVQELEINHNKSVLGKQKMHLLNPHTAFKITAFTREFDYHEQHLLKFVRISRLKALQWINFNHNVITFNTIMNK